MTCASITTADYQELVAYSGRRFARRLKRLSVPAHEIAHEVYLRAARGNVVWNSRAHFRNWSRLAANHALIDIHRKSSDRYVDELDPNLSGCSDERLGPQRIDLRMRRDELASIEPRQADAIRLRYIEGFTIRETALLLGISERTVKRDVATGLRWLRERLER